MADRKPFYVAVRRTAGTANYGFFWKRRNPEGTPVFFARKVRRCFSPAGELPGRKIMTRAVGAESGDQPQTVVILSERSREIIRLFEELQRKRQQAEQSPSC